MAKRVSFKDQGVFTDMRQAATRLPNLLVYFILMVNIGATTRQTPRDIKEWYLYNCYRFIALYQKNV